jgi:hypothetical protein
VFSAAVHTESAPAGHAPDRGQLTGTDTSSSRPPLMATTADTKA